jgi:hypothetical protein
MVTKFKRAKRAIAQTPQVTDDEAAGAHFAGWNAGIPQVLGFARKASLPPQALRYRHAPRAKATAHNRLNQSLLKYVYLRLPVAIEPDAIPTYATAVIALITSTEESQALKKGHFIQLGALAHPRR